MTLAQQRQYALKNLLERAAATVALVALAPLLALVALAVRLDSPGPVFFVQERVGRRGRRFRLYKFRSMIADADRFLDEVGCPSRDRVTRVGRWLRRTSLDELPQLWNIVRGDVALVGPRPLLPEHLYRCRDAERRHDVLPGLTGLAQINGRNTLPWSRRIEYDLQYVDRYSLWLDARILAGTMLVVLGGTGVVLDRNPTKVDDIPKDIPPGGETPMTCNAGRREPVLSGRYKKDQDFERVLATLNDTLAAPHDSDLQDLPEELPTIHVIGAPRSGTTLATQLLASCLDVGYVNNLVATFWRAPVYGLRLSQKLLPDAVPESFRSDYGRTSGIAEPHEFGYFWTHYLGYPEMREQPEAFESTVDWDRLRRVLVNMQHAAGKPMLFKSFLLAWHMERVAQAMPRSVFVWTRRPAGGERAVAPRSPAPAAGFGRSLGGDEAAGVRLAPP